MILSQPYVSYSIIGGTQAKPIDCVAIFWYLFEHLGFYVELNYLLAFLITQVISCWHENSIRANSISLAFCLTASSGDR